MKRGKRPKRSAPTISAPATMIEAVQGRGQYTIRGVPARVDRALRERARVERKSLNQVLLEALSKAAGGGEIAAPVHGDLDALAGRWEDDPATDEALRAQDRIDESLWR